MRIKHLLAFSVCLLFFGGCQDSKEELPKQDNSGVFFLVTNLTGHTFPPNDNVCGNAVVLIFELESDQETKEIVVMGDASEVIAINIVEGKRLKVRVREENGTITAQNNAVYKDIPEEEKILGYHSITVCPKDQIEFNF